MNLGELVLQTYNLADFLLANESTLDIKTKKESLSGILAAFGASLSCRENEDEISGLRALSSQEDFAVSDLYILTVTALIKFSAVGLGQVLPLQDQVNEKTNMLNNLTERFIHQQNIQTAYHKRYPGASGRFTGKGIVYSVITGNYDSINEPFTDDGYEHILLTDHIPDNYSGKWNIRLIDNKLGLPAHRLARYVKMHPLEFFPEYDYSIYIDGALQSRKDFHSFIDVYKKDSGIICFPHHSSNTLEEEADSISSNNKAPKEELLKQINDFKTAGYQGKGYIVETGCLLRDHRDDRLMKIMEDWWQSLCAYEHNRDQMSFDYAFWKNGYEYDLCDLPIYNNPWCVAVITH